MKINDILECSCKNFEEKATCSFMNGRVYHVEDVLFESGNINLLLCVPAPGIKTLSVGHLLNELKKYNDNLEVKARTHQLANKNYELIGFHRFNGRFDMRPDFS